MREPGRAFPAIPATCRARTAAPSAPTARWANIAHFCGPPIPVNYEGRIPSGVEGLPRESVMKVGSAGSTSSVSGTRKSDSRRKAEGVGFADLLDQAVGGVEDAGAVEGPVSLSGVEAILATQAVDPDGGARARARMARRGEDILDRLDAVRLGLLSGSVPKEDLADLARLVRGKREEGIDPRLGAILDEIELRAEVELAKLTRGLGAV